MVLMSLVLMLSTSVWFRNSKAQDVSEARARFKGWIGELKVRLLLKTVFRRCHQWHDRFIALPPGDIFPITQIDHVLCSRRGIFVIETKNVERQFRHRNRQTGAQDFAVTQNALHARAVFHWIDQEAPELGLTLYDITNVVVSVGSAKKCSDERIRIGLRSLWYHIWSQKRRLSDETVKRVAEILSTHLKKSNPAAQAEHRLMLEGKPPAALFKALRHEGLSGPGVEAASVAVLQVVEKLLEFGTPIKTIRSAFVDSPEVFELLKQRFGEFTTGKLDRKGQSWSEDERDLLAELISLGLSDEEVAKLLGRSAKAVDFELKRCGLRD
ncbi:MAG: NERD domain-containing protein [Myxococcota bacterium]